MRGPVTVSERDLRLLRGPASATFAFSKRYDWAMSLVTRSDAERYFERLVRERMSWGSTREEAERIERSNLRDYANHHLDATRECVERIFELG